MSQYYYNPFGNSGVNEESQRAFLHRQQEIKEKREIRQISFTMGIAIIAYLAIQSFASLALEKLGLDGLYNSNPAFQSAFIIIGVSFLSVLVPFGVMALVNRKKYVVPVIPSGPIKPVRCFAWVSFGMICCLLANFSVSYLIAFLEALFGVTFETGTMLEPNSVFACVMEVIGTAIIPAICEEVAMRCCSLQLLRKYGKGFAVFAVSIVFGLLHGNVTQFIFAFLIGLVLGFATVKTDSIVPAVLIHALNNGMSVFKSIMAYSLGEKAGDASIYICFGLWVVLGALGTIYLFVKGEFKSSGKRNSSVLTTGQKFSAFLFPWMIVPFFILLFLTFLSISNNSL